MKKILALLFVATALMLIACGEKDVVADYVAYEKGNLQNSKPENGFKWVDVSLETTGIVYVFEIDAEMNDDINVALTTVFRNMMNQVAEKKPQLLETLEERNMHFTFKIVDVNKETYQMNFSKKDLEETSHGNPSETPQKNVVESDIISEYVAYEKVKLQNTKSDNGVRWVDVSLASTGIVYVYEVDGERNESVNAALTDVFRDIVNQIAQKNPQLLDKLEEKNMNFTFKVIDNSKEPFIVSFTKKDLGNSDVKVNSDYDVISEYVASEKVNLQNTKPEDGFKWVDISLETTGIVYVFEIDAEMNENINVALTGSVRNMMNQIVQKKPELLDKLEEKNMNITFKIIDGKKESYEMPFSKKDLQ